MSRSLSSGAHSRGPLAHPGYATSLKYGLFVRQLLVGRNKRRGAERIAPQNATAPGRWFGAAEGSARDAREISARRAGGRALRAGQGKARRVLSAAGRR